MILRTFKKSSYIFYFVWEYIFPLSNFSKRINFKFSKYLIHNNKFLLEYSLLSFISFIGFLLLIRGLFIFWIISKYEMKMIHFYQERRNVFLFKSKIIIINILLLNIFLFVHNNKFLNHKKIYLIKYLKNFDLNFLLLTL